MKVLISGASGLVGGALVPHWTAAGHTVLRLVRSKTPGEGEIGWDPRGGKLEPSDLEGVDAVVHLAGENIASGRWTAARKREIRDSRVRGTRLVAEALAKCERAPRVLIAASAIGFYGDRGEEELTEDSENGEGFLAEVCREWEEASRAAREDGIRVVNARIGVVLSKEGGALKKMLMPFRLGLGGRIGSGRQSMSWISLDDLVLVLDRVLNDDSLSGPVNAVSPNPVSNAEFTRTLGRALGRPTIFPMPAFAARLAFGEMGDELLLSSQRVVPRKLLAAGFEFRYPALENALRHVLAK